MLIRVRSGVVAGPEPYCETPCPMEQTPPLPLVRGWDPTRPTLVQAAPPAGFAALVRILHMPPARLNACMLPLDQVDVISPLLSGSITLGTRLGCGGSSDVYTCTLPGGSIAALKLARAATERVRALFEAEAVSLSAMCKCPPGAAPQLLCRGSLEQPARTQVLPGAAPLPWPLLLLSPVGIPLSDALRDHVGSAADKRTARRDFGDLVMRDVLHCLRAAHGERIAHCDVRPTNIVVICGPSCPPAALLIDYGLSRCFGVDAAHLGVRAYAADCVFTQKRCAARAGLHLIGAAFTWISCVYGDDTCQAPWRASHEQRAEWPSREAQSDRVLAGVVSSIELLARPGTAPMAERWYVWPWAEERM